MARTPRQALAISPVAPNASLVAIASVAERLASSDALEDIVPAVLETVRAAAGGEECVLWLYSRGALARGWSAGVARTNANDIEEALAALPDSVRPSLTVAALTSGGRAIGALSLFSKRAFSVEALLLFRAAGNMLAPEIAHAELQHQLAIEVALRTRQIDQQRRFIERIIDSLPVGLYVIDREYRIHAWNRKRETGMQGVSREEAIGRTIFEILHRQPAELLRREFEDVFRTGSIQQFQMESTASGELRTFRISKIPMRVDDVNVTHVITIGEDVTDWKEAEHRIAQAEKLAAIGTLAAGVMHEINNPMATIAACAESLLLRLEDQKEGRTFPPDSDEYLRIIDNEVHRCKRIIDGLLDFSRPKEATKEPLDVNYVIEQTLFLLKHHTRFKKLTVTTSLDPEIGPDVAGNPEQLVQVFMALLLNATDAMSDRGTITIRTRRGRAADEWVIAEVIDEGNGIPRSEITKIFEPFYTTKAPGRGTGLGLSICYGIVADHGGRIEADSTLGKGSIFRVILPAAASA